MPHHARLCGGQRDRVTSRSKVKTSVTNRDTVSGRCVDYVRKQIKRMTITGNAEGRWGSACVFGCRHVFYVGFWVVLAHPTRQRSYVRPLPLKSVQQRSVISFCRLLVAFLCSPSHCHHIQPCSLFLPFSLFFSFILSASKLLDLKCNQSHTSFTLNWNLQKMNVFLLCSFGSRDLSNVWGEKKPPMQLHSYLHYNITLTMKLAVT